MAAPVRSAFAQSAWTGTGTSKSSGTISWNAGDLVVILALSEDAVCTISVANQLGLTLTNGGAVGTAASTCFANSWSAVASNSQSGVTVAATASDSTHDWGIGVWVFTNHNGIGNRATDITTAKTVSLTRAGNNSMVVGVQGDFSASASTGYSFTPTIANDIQHTADTGRYTPYVGDWGDQGAAGTTSYGTTGETSTGTFAKLALEIKGATATASPVNPARPGQTWLRQFHKRQQLPVITTATASSVNLDDTGSGADALTVSATTTLADTGAGSDALTVSATVPLADVGTGTDALTVTASLPLSDTGTGTDALSVTATVALADTGTGADGITVTATVPLTDSGTGVDAITVDTGTPNKSLPDTGSGADAITATATIPLSDIGAGADALTVSVSPTLADTGLAVDALTVIVTPVLADAGTAADSLGVTATIPLIDAATAADVLSVIRGGVVTPTSRTVFVGVDIRTVYVVETRTLYVLAQPRTVTVATDARTLYTQPQNRTSY